LGATLFAGTFLPDSILYDGLYDVSGVTFSELLSDLAGNSDLGQNILAISALTTTYRNAGLDPIHVNVVLVALAGLLLLRICLFYNASPRAPLLVLFLNPSTIFYSQTSTKEILTLFASTLFAFALIRARSVSRLILSMVALLMTYAFRVQSAIPMLAIFFLSYASSRLQQRAWILMFLGLSLTLPILYSSGLIQAEVAEYFRLEFASVTGTAKYVDFGLRQIPFAGLVLLPFRMLQNATEPFPALHIFQFDVGGTTVVSLYSIVTGATVVVTWFFTCEFIRIFWRLIVRGEEGPRQIDSIILYAGLFWLMIATNPFVHTRYLYNVFPIFALISTLNRTHRGAGREQPTCQSVATQQEWQTGPSWAAWCALMAASGAILLF